MSEPDYSMNITLADLLRYQKEQEAIRYADKPELKELITLFEKRRIQKNAVVVSLRYDKTAFCIDLIAPDKEERTLFTYELPYPPKCPYTFVGMVLDYLEENGYKIDPIARRTLFK